VNTYTGQISHLHCAWQLAEPPHFTCLFLHLPSSKPLWWSFTGLVSFCWSATLCFIVFHQKVGCFLYIASFLATNAMKPPQLVSLTRFVSKPLAYDLICGEVIPFVPKSYSGWQSKTSSSRIHLPRRLKPPSQRAIVLHHVLHCVLYFSTCGGTWSVCRINSGSSHESLPAGEDFFQKPLAFFPLTRRSFVKHPGVPNFH